jgi:hypothetical protein
MYSIKTAGEAYKAANYYEKQNGERALIDIAVAIDNAIRQGYYKIYVKIEYPQVYSTLSSLGYNITPMADANYYTVSWEKGQ